MTAVRQLLLAARERVAHHPLAALLVAAVDARRRHAGRRRRRPTRRQRARRPRAPLSAERFEAGLREASDHGFLWRLVKNGRTSYLYGTIHAARLEWMFPGPRITAALAASDVLALELDVLDSDIQARLAASARAAPEERLAAPLQQRIDRRMVAECIDPAPWHAFAPEFQIASLSVLAARREGFDPAYAIDVVLALIAHQIGKPIVSLETPEAQVAALRMPSRAATIELVESAASTTSTPAAPARSSPGWCAPGPTATWPSSRTTSRWCECLRNDAERAAMKRLLDDRNPVTRRGDRRPAPARPACVRRRRQPAHDRPERLAGAARPARLPGRAGAAAHAERGAETRRRRALAG